MPDHVASSSMENTPPVALAVAVAGAVLFLDAAIETSRAGSGVRWWVVGGAAVYVAATAATWRMRFGWRGRLAATILGMLGLIAVTAWGPGGLTDGIRIAGQPTTRLLGVLAAAGVALAGLVLSRIPRLPVAARAGIAAVAVYGVAAFFLAAVFGTSLATMLAGESLWRALPKVLQGAFLGGILILPAGLAWSAVRAGLRRPADASARSDLWKAAAMAASLAIVVAGLPLRSTPPGGAAQAPAQAAGPEGIAATLGIDPNAPRLTPAELNTALANSIRAIEDGEREGARDRWDPGYVTAALGSDPQRLLAFVQNYTSWIPYRGLLRGATGVLMDRQGNSLDRAVLLATLLRKANRTVRLAHATLSEEQAMELLRPLAFLRYAGSAPVPDRPAAYQAPSAASYQLDRASLLATMTLQADSRTRKQAELLARVPDQARRLAAAVGAPPSDAARQALDRAIEALRDHYWVQALEGAGTWQDLDLLAPPGTTLTTSIQTFSLEALPNELRHQVTIRVVAEQWSNGSLAEHTALERVLVPADIIGAPIVLQFVPEKLLKAVPPNTTPRQSMRAQAIDQHEWTPTLVVGRTPFAQSTIRDTGDLTRGNPAGKSPAAGAMSGLAQRLEDALGPSTPPTPQSKPVASGVLTSASIEYEIRAPGERPQKIRRSLFDLIGPTARAARPVAPPQVSEAAALARSLALMRETEILPVVCRIAPAFVTHLSAQSVIANKDLLTAVARGDFADDFTHAQQVATRLVPTPTSLYTLALARFEWSPVAEQIFIDRPNILTRHTFFSPSGSGFALVVATDIVANAIGVDPIVRDPFGVRLEQGVLDTNAEAVLTTDRPSAANAGAAYAAPGRWTTLRSPGDPQLAGLALAGDVRKRIADDLAAGYVVVAPTAPVTVGSAAFSGWWRVDPATGQVLGMGSTGWGQEMVEYLVTVAWSAGLAFLFAYMWCQMVSAGETPVAGGCTATPRDGGFALQDLLMPPVYAIGSACLHEALFAAALGGLLGGIGKWAGSKPGGSGAGDKADPLGDTLPDPFAKTEPGGPGGGGQTGPGQGSGGPPAGGGAGKPGPLPWGGKVPGGVPPGEPPAPGATPGNPPPEFPPDIQKEIDAFKKWQQTTGPDKGKAFQEWLDAFRDSLRANPQIPDDLKKLISPPGTPWGTPVSPPAGTPPTGPTGPGGTQVIPPTGPGGTQIIPPAPASPTAPTQPMLCPGPGCPPSPYEKTQTGLTGVLNVLGQKTGG